MFKIAIVEDQEETRESLNRFVRQYAQEQGLQVEISLITDGARSQSTIRRVRHHF